MPEALETEQQALVGRLGRSGVGLQPLSLGDQFGGLDCSCPGPWHPGPDCDRFAIDVVWRDSAGNEGDGELAPLGSDDLGILYFFAPDN